MRILLKVEPYPKARAKTRFNNGKAFTYTPTKTVNATEAIKAILLEQGITPFPALIPLRMKATFFRTKSKWLKKKEPIPCRKPDTDNFLRLLTDSMTGIVFADDSQLSYIVSIKRWTNRRYGYIIVEMKEDKL